MWRGARAGSGCHSCRRRRAGGLRRGARVGHVVDGEIVAGGTRDVDLSVEVHEVWRWQGVRGWLEIAHGRLASALRLLSSAEIGTPVQRAAKRTIALRLYPPCPILAALDLDVIDAAGVGRVEAESFVALEVDTLSIVVCLQGIQR
eukprot:402082-Rhodomonas_salina.2